VERGKVEGNRKASDKSGAFGVMIFFRIQSSDFRIQIYFRNASLKPRKERIPSKPTVEIA
jgi:hypothetical protein